MTLSSSPYCSSCLLAFLVIFEQLSLATSFLPTSSVGISCPAGLTRRATTSICLSAKKNIRRSRSTIIRPSPSTDSEDETTTKPTILPAAHSLVRNLFSVCAHLQNPNLYTPQWADHATLVPAAQGTSQKKPILVTSCPLQIGEIVSLYPIDGLGLRTSLSTSTSKSERKPAKKKKARQQQHPNNKASTKTKAKKKQES